jgi:hypothetical protein
LLVRFSLIIRAFTITRRSRSPGPRCSAERLKRSAAAWPRPIRQHLPFRGRFPPLPRRPSRLICAAVSGPPFAFAAAFRTWLTNDVERRPARLPRSRMRPDRGRRSEASSWLIRERLRQLRSNASPNRRTSCHVVEKERRCDKTHIAQNRGWQKNNVQTRPYRQTKVCFNLAILINVAELAQIHAKSRITAQHHFKEIVLSIARQTRCERHKRSTKTTRRRVEE